MRGDSTGPIRVAFRIRLHARRSLESVCPQWTTIHHTTMHHPPSTQPIFCFSHCWRRSSSLDPAWLMVHAE